MENYCKRCCRCNSIYFVSCRSVKGLVGFTKIKELVLDNNNLTDDVEFPEMDSVETLTVNKNNVSFSRDSWDRKFQCSGKSYKF